LRETMLRLRGAGCTGSKPKEVGEPGDRPPVRAAADPPAVAKESTGKWAEMKAAGQAAPPLEAVAGRARSKSTKGAARASAAVTIQKVFRGRSQQLSNAVRRQIQDIVKEKIAEACAGGIDAMGDLFQKELGTNVWARAVLNAPDEWQEYEMAAAISDLLKNPSKSPHVWLLAKPSKFERAVLDLAKDVGGKRAEKAVRLNESAAATLIQKNYRGTSKKLSVPIRVALEGVPPEKAAAACDKGMDGMGDLIGTLLGTNVWARALRNAPDEWEEDDFIGALHEAILRPGSSGHLWLFAKPTKYERALLAAFRPVEINAHI